MLQNVRRSLALFCIVVESARLPFSALGFVATSLAPPPSKSKARLFMMDLAAAQPPELLPELLVVAHFDANDESSKDRLRSLPSSMSARHGDRVAVRLQAEACAEEGPRNGSLPSDSGAPAGASAARFGEGCLPAFQFVRAGLTIDEYHAHDDTPYEEELGKRVDAALSLSRPEDSSTLKELWSPDAAGGDYRDEMAVATYAVHVASRVARELQEELCKQDAISKSDSSPVTVADFSVQAIVLGVLSRYFPGHGFIAEETSPVLRQDPAALSSVLGVVSRVLGLDLTEAELCAAIDLGTRGHGKHERGHWGRGGRTWVLDPIDGTKGFLRGEQFCVALGLLDGGKAVAGILGCPNLPADEDHPAQGSSGSGDAENARGLLYTAALGEGSFVRPLSAGADDTRRIMVEHARRPSEARVLESVEATHTSHAVAAQVCSDLNISLPPIRVDGQCKYGLLSEGQGGIYLRLPQWGYVENIWDHVAGAVVIREAGGKVTDSRGEPLDFSLGAKLPREVVGVVATSGKIHAEVLRAVHNRQLEDWARVVADAKDGDWESGDAAPQLPGVDWAYWNNGREGVGEEWWARAAEQRQPLVMRTSEQFYGTLERGWDKLVAVLFHGSWTQESQHAVSILECLAGRQHAPPIQLQQQGEQQQQQQQQQQQEEDGQQKPQHEQARQQKLYSSSPISDFELQKSQPPPPPPPPLTSLSSSSSSSSPGSLERSSTATAEAPPAETKTCVGGGGGGAGDAVAPRTISILLAEADVVSLIDVADRQAIAGLPSLHLHLGGREIVRFPVDSGESADSLGARIDEVASRVCEAGRRYQR